ncbi:helix-turn-helix transcriptional regulator [Paenibacillus sp. IB182496]|uniref:Helix-turn-helix transcriptional regulator n=1 Tax=Paenibacillus sabuli TaxID=2772509 RepID=A0A927GSG1_9BACL|nr:helix-turn-helix transcriptional regulator [Paenibacillus sabuli]MBD2846528.1 helix-turn-helix transcriptional regulator [Paenibacillus sabuli]
MMRSTVTRMIKQLEKSAADSWAYRKALLELLRPIVPFDAACCTLVDPNTLLSTGAMFEEGVEAIHHDLFRHEYTQSDFNVYEEIVASTEPVRALSLSTGGALRRSGRFREVLEPAGFGDELRAALVIDRACWGYLTLFRRAHHPRFNEQDCECIQAIVPSVARVLRSAGLALPDPAATMNTGRGMLLLTEQFDCLASNAAAHDWLSHLRQMEQLSSDSLPCTVQAVCARALKPQTESRAHVCIPIPDIGYLAVRAHHLKDAIGSIQLAVSLEPAQSSDFMPLVTDAYALSAREKQITALLFRGLSTKELAAELNISSHTVQDHMKSIFAKTGATNRREVMWRILSGSGVPVELKS